MHGGFVWKTMEGIDHQKINDGGEKDGLEPTQEGISNEGSKYGQETRHTNPDVDILSRCRNRLVEFVCEVCDEVPRHAKEHKSLSHLNNCMQFYIIRTSEKGDRGSKMKIKGGGGGMAYR